jgi:hypothetical protein
VKPEGAVPPVLTVTVTSLETPPGAKVTVAEPSGLEATPPCVAVT